MWILAAFVAVPLIEIALFIQVGGLIGLWPTLAIVIATAVAGTWALRSQGRATVEDLRRRFDTLADPTEPLAHGAMILFAGALLLTPGFFTDTVGLLLMVPAVRTAVMRWLGKRVEVRRFEMGQHPGGPRRPDPSRRRPDDVIEGDWQQVDPAGPKPRPDDETRPPKRPTHHASGWTRH
ncbi:FxsA family protein [Rhodosalinus sp.]|uniref:FxsA family protein n=1 Tax=Rhodosalinus sp. TaxID=2047741 RepID=UPI003978702B